jgi:hypothetical protein
MIISIFSLLLPSSPSSELLLLLMELPENELKESLTDRFYGRFSLCSCSFRLSFLYFWYFYSTNFCC